MEVADGEATGCLSIAIGHAHHYDFVEPEDVAQPVFDDKGIEQRQFGGAGIAKNDIHAFRMQKVEENMFAGAFHPCRIARFG